jgi:hypothetical protein
MHGNSTFIAQLDAQLLRMPLLSERVKEKSQRRAYFQKTRGDHDIGQGIFRTIWRLEDEWDAG